jgi:hypothetical protein
VTTGYDNALDLTYDEDGRVVGYSIGGTRGYGIEEWKRKTPGGAWKDRPFVWVVSFEVVR